MLFPPYLLNDVLEEKGGGELIYENKKFLVNLSKGIDRLEHLSLTESPPSPKINENDKSC